MATVTKRLSTTSPRTRRVGVSHAIRPGEGRAMTSSNAAKIGAIDEDAYWEWIEACDTSLESSEMPSVGSAGNRDTGERRGRPARGPKSAARYRSLSRRRRRLGPIVRKYLSSKNPPSDAEGPDSSQNVTR